MWVIMSLVLLIVLLVLALRPTLVTISGLFGQIEQQEIISARLDDKILSLRKAISEMEAVEPDLQVLSDAIPDQPNWDVLAGELYKAATESGLDITSVSIEKIPTSPIEPVSDQIQATSLVPKGLISIRFSLSAIGTEEQITNALMMIEKMKRLALFPNVAIEEDKDGRLNLTVSGEASYIPEMYLL